MFRKLKSAVKRHALVLSALGIGAVAGAGIGAKYATEASRLAFAERLSRTRPVTGDLVSGFDPIAEFLAKKETKKLREVTSQIEESVKGAARAHGINLPDFTLNCRLKDGLTWFDLSAYPALRSNRAALLHVTELLELRKDEFYDSIYAVFGRFAEFQEKHGLRTPEGMVEYFRKHPPANPKWAAMGAGTGFVAGGLTLAAIAWLARRRTEKESAAGR
ncbi:MAG: hypothetical protein HY544_00950 [Candidatus Diapherotrites archaeon]|uniref:Uncharacterized protein n=1 Tax=Candidatus Iainarchaeum sp. TaxID=3101447 RepID=A0A8T3YK56_9ARCH|nr:hypothetical protein [Candidatus Diapherotrites archaeon]